MQQGGGGERALLEHAFGDDGGLVSASRRHR
jgi:hypothetical protein